MQFKWQYTLLLILLLSSCKKEATTWDSEYVAPIAHTRITVSNLIGDTNILINTDNTVDLHIERTLFELDIDSLFDTPDTTFSEVYATLLPLSASPGYTFVSNPQETTYDVGSAELKFIRLRSGTLNYEVLSYIDGPTLDSIVFESAALNGSALVEEIYIAASDGTTPVIVRGSLDLSGYDLDLTGSDGLNYNTLQTRILASVDPNHSAPVAVGPEDSMRVNVAFENIVPDFVRGYFGSEIIEVQDTTSIPILENITNGTLNLNDIQLDLVIENGVGVDLQAQIIGLNSINTTSVALAHSVIGSTININRGFHVGGTTTSSTYPISFTSLNSNLEAFIENIPRTIGYDLSLSINPFGNTSSHNDFYDYNAPLKASMTLDMPLCLATNNLTFLDTVNLTIDLDSTGVQNGEITIKAINNFPFAADIQILLPDGNGDYTDPIIAPNSILSATVDGSNIVTDAVSSEIVITLSSSQISQLARTDKAALQIVFNTAGTPNDIKLYENYWLDLNLFAKVNYQFEVQ